MKVIVEKVKPLLRDSLYRWRLLRRMASALWNATHPGTRYQTDHLTFFREEEVMGPLQRDEALFLFALTRVQRPAVVVEFGFHYGHSAFNFLQAMPPGSRLYSYDVADTALAIARSRFSQFPNFRFLHKSQTEFSAADIENQPIDLCFLDASHLLDLNQETFRKLQPSLAPGAIIAVHDTGTWMKPFFGAVHRKMASANTSDWLSESEFQPCKGEREFVNWVLTHCPGFSEIHLHSKQTLRNGFTLIQKTQQLATTPPGREVR